MTGKMFLLFLAGIVTGAAAVSVVGKIYVDNLHHVACQMYNSVDDSFRFQYVNKQFGCNAPNMEFRQ